MAMRELSEMQEALRSAEEQLKSITTKRRLGTLFTRQPYNVDGRAAKALEMALGKPKWTEYIDKANRDDGEDWSGFMA